MPLSFSWGTRENLPSKSWCRVSLEARLLQPSCPSVCSGCLGSPQGFPLRGCCSANLRCRFAGGLSPGLPCFIVVAPDLWPGFGSASQIAWASSDMRVPSKRLQYFVCFIAFDGVSSDWPCAVQQSLFAFFALVAHCACRGWSGWAGFQGEGVLGGLLVWAAAVWAEMGQGVRAGLGRWRACWAAARLFRRVSLVAGFPRLRRVCLLVGMLNFCCSGLAGCLGRSVGPARRCSR